MKLPRFFRFSHSMATRLTVRVVSTMTIVFTLICALIFGIVWLISSAFISILYSTVMNVSDERINGIFSAVEVAVTNNMSYVKENIDRDLRLEQVAEHIVQVNPNIIGSCVAFNPDYGPRKGRPTAYYAYRDSTDVKKKQVGNDYLQQEWYEQALREGKAFWTEPYANEEDNLPRVTFSKPLLDEEGKAYAVLTADIALDWITQLKNETDSIVNADYSFVQDTTFIAYSFMVTRKGAFLAHPENKSVFSENIYDYFKRICVKEDSARVNYLYQKNQMMVMFMLKEGRHFIFSQKIEHPGWTMCVVIPLRQIIAPSNYFTLTLAGLMLFALIVVGLVCRHFIHRITKPLTHFTQSADEIAKGNFQTELPDIKSQDEMFKLRESFETMQKSLVQQIEQTKTMNEEKGRMEGELRIAREIQMSMLPKTFPAFPDRTDIDIYALLTPAKEVGGDLYDFYIRDEKLFFCIGDVSGKGVPASLVMAVTRSLFRTVSAHESNPSKIVASINELIAEDNKSNMFVTLFMGVLDLPTGRLHFCNAGHDRPLIIDGEGAHLMEVDANLPVGVMPGMRFSTQNVHLTPGTALFLYTDGLTEAENDQLKQFGKSRMMALADLTSPQALVERMAAAVQDYVSGAEQNDDMTMMAIQYSRQKSEVKMKDSLTLSNNIDEVPQLAVFIDRVCEEIGLDMGLTMNLNLALEEAVVNIMSYAYPTGTQGLVHIEAEANDDRVKFVITDQGMPFDPTAMGEVDTTLSLEERPTGGLGIHLVRQIMDTINYERIGENNVLTLRKKIV